MTVSESRACARCAAPLGRGVRLDGAGGLQVVCVRCALRDRALVLRSLRVALVVGTILTAINQGGAILSGAWTASLAWKIPLTYVVPYVVATWGALGSLRER